MTDFLYFSFASAILYFISLVVIYYAYGRTKKIKLFLICLVVVTFGIFNGWAMSVNQDKIPLDSVEKAWENYTNFCSEEHISWSDLTFPEWLSLKTSE